MQLFELQNLIQKHTDQGKFYYEFLSVDTLSMGIYKLPAGGTDPQDPHQEDEVYYVINGRSQVTVGDETRAIQTGDTLFVGKHIHHKFHDITEDLTILVFFAPPESTPTN